MVELDVPRPGAEGWVRKYRVTMRGTRVECQDNPQLAAIMQAHVPAGGVPTCWPHPELFLAERFKERFGAVLVSYDPGPRTKETGTEKP